MLYTLVYPSKGGLSCHSKRESTLSALPPLRGKKSGGKTIAPSKRWDKPSMASWSSPSRRTARWSLLRRPSASPRAAHSRGSTPLRSSNPAGRIILFSAKKKINPACWLILRTSEKKERLLAPRPSGSGLAHLSSAPACGLPSQSLAFAAFS